MLLVYCKGYLFPKGANILPTILSMHYDPELFPEPEKFKPERFLNNTRTMQSCANGKLEERDTFMFGWGRRACPGVHLVSYSNSKYICIAYIFINTIQLYIFIYTGRGSNVQYYDPRIC